MATISLPRKVTYFVWDGEPTWFYGIGYITKTDIKPGYIIAFFDNSMKTYKSLDEMVKCLSQ